MAHLIFFFFSKNQPEIILSKNSLVIINFFEKKEFYLDKIKKTHDAADGFLIEYENKFIFIDELYFKDTHEMCGFRRKLDIVLLSINKKS